MPSNVIEGLTDKFKRAMFGGLTEDQVLLGITSGSLNFADRGGIENKNIANAKKEEKRKAEQASEILRTIQSIINRLEANITAYEKEFEHRDGDAWREKLALGILDENEIPPRLDGESIEVYRDRLETHLINEMLNDDGTIKTRFKNDPEFKDYARWARDKHHLSLTKELNTPETSTTYHGSILEKLTVRYGDRVLEQTAEQGGLLEKLAKTQMDAKEQSEHEDQHTHDTASNFSVGW